MQILLLLVAGVLLSGNLAANVKRPLKIDHRLTKGMPLRRRGAIKFLTMTSRPVHNVTHVAGTVLKLACEAVGSPAPTVQWLKNDVPMLEYSMDNNEVLTRSSTSLGSVVSTLMIGEPSSNSEDVYSCRVHSGHNTTSASTIVYTVDSNSDLSERYRLMPMKPHIMTHYKVYMDTHGSTAVFPCKAKGHPQPKIYWRDRNHKIVGKKHNRMKVLRSGDLVISPLIWSDMGEFTCIARNNFGKETLSTFVYPVKPS